MERPETRYANVGDAHIAYQVVGDGPIDLVFLQAITSHVDWQWEHPLSARFLQRLASFSRLILFDRRGVGASDRVPVEAVPTWEAWAEDVRVILDEVGSDRAALMAELDAGPTGIVFAATYPDRVHSLVLINTAAKYLNGPGYGSGLDPGIAEGLANTLESMWTQEELIRMVHPGHVDDRPFIEWRTKLARSAVTPREAGAQFRHAFALDARAVLPSIHVPTLILHRREAPFIPIEMGRYLAEHIEGARLAELPGADQWLFSQGADEALDLIEEFLVGAPRRETVDRVLATVLFTDIVDSTRRAAELGDRRWREILDAHDDLSRVRVDQHGGRVVKTTGDGLVATFDGPGRAINGTFDLIGALAAVGIEIRAGLHTGEIELRGGGDVGGIGVHIASRVMEEAAPGELVCSRTVKDLVVGSGFSFEDRGTRELRGIPDDWQLFAVRA